MCVYKNTDPVRRVGQSCVAGGTFLFLDSFNSSSVFYSFPRTAFVILLLIAAYDASTLFGWCRFQFMCFVSFLLFFFIAIIYCSVVSDSFISIS